MGVSCQQALDSIYADYDDGELINGIDIFSRTYERAKLLLYTNIIHQNSSLSLLTT